MKFYLITVDQSFDCIITGFCFHSSGQIKEWVQTHVFGKAKSPKAELEIDCDTCHIGISLALSFLEQGDMEEVGNALIGLCQDLQIVADDVCEGIVDLEFVSRCSPSCTTEMPT